MSRSPFTVVAVLAAALAIPAAVGAAQPGSKPAQGGAKKSAGGIYKWVDDQGVTHYGQSIPPEYRDAAATEMNRRGLTVREIDAAQQPESPEAKAERAKQEREEKRRQYEQRRRDLALMKTYTSAEEIDLARERNLAVPTQALRGLEPRLKEAQERLSGLQAMADKVVQGGQSVPPHLQDDIADQGLKVDGLRAEIDRYNALITAIRTRFDADRKRFVELSETAKR